MKSKYDATIKAAFGSDRSFVNALHQSFENFVNLNTRQGGIEKHPTDVESTKRVCASV
jgi:hypothetical protein